MAQKAWKQYLTEEEYWSLGTDGRAQMDYWAQFKPKMCRELAEAGTLLEAIQTQSYYLDEMHESLLNSGLPEDAAMDFVREALYSQKPDDEYWDNDPLFLECLEEELRYQWAHSKTRLSFEEWKKKPKNIQYAKDLLKY